MPRWVPFLGLLIFLGAFSVGMADWLAGRNLKIVEASCAWDPAARGYVASVQAENVDDRFKLASIRVQARLRPRAGQQWPHETLKNQYSAISQYLVLAFEPRGSSRGETTFEVAAKDSLGGDFTFRRLIANLRGRAPLPGRQRLDLRLLLGFSGGTLPSQKRFALGGIGTLRGYDVKAFPGEHLALANLEWSLAPSTLLPRFIAFYDGGMAWSRGQDGAGWKSDLGLGLRFPADAGSFLRLDFARALGDAREKRVRTGFRIQLPF